ncbi:MAG: hypothetical protein OCD02_16275 [Spirochaetaceae bacterium]
MIKRVFTIVLLIIFASLFFPLANVIYERNDVGDLAKEYLVNGAADLGAPNLVTAVVVTYRGLDTLGEVTVLFAAAAGVALVFSQFHGKKREEEGDSPSEILETGAMVLLPLIFVFGIYIFVFGHISPGGGFQGGVIIASGVILALFGGTLKGLNHSLISFLEGLAGVSYVAVGLLGLWLAGGFLDPRFLPMGEFGSLFSAGAIPVIYSLVGIKVGSEMSGLIDGMRSYS